MMHTVSVAAENEQNFLKILENNNLIYFSLSLKVYFILLFVWVTGTLLQTVCVAAENGQSFFCFLKSPP